MTPSGSIFNVRDFGASGDGIALDSVAINAAIQACHHAGGGTVSVPPGQYRCGTIRLESHIHFQLQPGAVLRSTENVEDFIPVEGMKHGTGMVIAYQCENIVIEGGGTIDGRSDIFMDWTKVRPCKSDGRFCNGEESPVQERDRLDRMVYFDQCKQVRIENVQLIDSPHWTLTCVDSEDLWLQNLKITANPRVPNNDGIHLCYCRRAFIQSCYISTADDCIALTNISCDPAFADALPLDANGEPTWVEDIVISDCIFNSRGAAVRIGFSTGCVRRVSMHSCLITAQRGILVSARNEGVVEHVRVQNCQIDTKLYSGNWWGCGEPFQIIGMGNGGGYIRDIEMSSLNCTSEHGAVIWNDHRYTMEDIRIHNCRITLCNSRHGETIGGHLDLRPRSRERDTPPTSGYIKSPIPGILARHIDRLELVGCNITFPENPARYFSKPIEIEACENAVVHV